MFCATIWTIQDFHSHSPMRIAFIHFSDVCEVQKEIFVGLANAGLTPVDFLGPWEELEAFEGFILAGLPELQRLHNVKINLQNFFPTLKKESALGKPIIGLGLGAQLLVDYGLVPGLADDQVGLSLIIDKNLEKSDSIYIQLSPLYQYNAFTRCLNEMVLLPAKNPYSLNFLIKPALRYEMQENGLLLFHYSNLRGQLISPEAIAAISNKQGNVLAMAAHLDWSSLENKIFHSMREYIEEGYRQKVKPLSYQPR